MALRPSSFIRNPLLLLMLSCVLGLGALAFSLTFCTAGQEVSNDYAPVEEARDNVLESNNVATIRAYRSDVKPEVQKGWLGVRIQTLTPQRAAAADIDIKRGVQILDVQPGLAAHASGFQMNDVVTHFNGRPVTTHCQLKQAVHATQAGMRVPVRVVRDGVALVLYPKLTAMADSPYARVR